MPDDGDDKTIKPDTPPDLAWGQLPEERILPGGVTITAEQVAGWEAESKAEFRAKPPAWWRAELARTQEDIESGLIDELDPDPGSRALVRRYWAAKARGEVIDMVAIYNAHEADPDTYADAAVGAVDAQAKAEGHARAKADAEARTDAEEEARTGAMAKTRARLRAMLRADALAAGLEVAPDAGEDETVKAGADAGNTDTEADIDATDATDVEEDDDDPAARRRQRQQARLDKLIAEAEADDRHDPAEDFMPVTPQLLRDAGLIDESGADITPTPLNDADQAAFRRWQELRRIEQREQKLRRRRLAQVLDSMVAQATRRGARGRGGVAAQAAELTSIRRQYLRMLTATEKYVLIEVDRIAAEITATTTTAAAENVIPVSSFRELLTANYGFPTASLVLWRKLSQARTTVGLEPCVVSNLIYWPGRRPVLQRQRENNWLFNTWRPDVEVAPLPVSDDQADVGMFRRLTRHLLPHAVWDQAAYTWFLADGLTRRGEARITWAPYTISLPGAGKGSLRAVGAALFGRGNAHVQQGVDALRGVENHIYSTSEWVVLEDLHSRAGANFGPAEDNFEYLKHLLVDPQIWLKQKFRSGRDAAVYSRVALFANSSDTLAIPADDRRLLVLQGNQTDRLPTEIAAWAHGLQDRSIACGTLLRWLLDQYEPLTEEYGFSPFRLPVAPSQGPDQLSASARLREDIREETMPADTFLAHVVAEDLRDRRQRTVIAASEVTNLAVRRRAGPGGDTSVIRLSSNKVQAGIKLAGFQFAGRPRTGGQGRPAARERLYALGKILEWIADLPESERLAALAKQLRAEQLAEDFRA